MDDDVTGELSFKALLSGDSGERAWSRRRIGRVVKITNRVQQDRKLADAEEWLEWLKSMRGPLSQVDDLEAKHPARQA